MVSIHLPDPVKLYFHFYLACVFKQKFSTQVNRFVRKQNRNMKQLVGRQHSGLFGRDPEQKFKALLYFRSDAALFTNVRDY